MIKKIILALVLLSAVTIPLSVTAARPDCTSSDSDPDGDGFGWENGRSCTVVKVTAVTKPDCVRKDSDRDGDGFGWENGRSCRVSASGSAKPTCLSKNSDPDGDGFGWENGSSCVVPASTRPVCESAGSDPDGDGFGWEKGRSCRAQERSSAVEERIVIKHPACSGSRYDPDGDGFGWENSVTCTRKNIGDGGRTITDLVLVTGQSNALGAETVLLDPQSFDQNLDSPVRGVYVYSDTGWTIASLRQIWDLGWYPRSDIAGDPANNFAFHFAKQVVLDNPDKVVGFVLSTAPGKAISHWDREGAFFKALSAKVERAISALPGNAGSAIDAVLWHQGETDFYDTDYYAGKLRALVSDIRRESWFSSNGFFICGETLNAPVNKRLMALNNDNDDRTACVSSRGLESVGDGVHFNASSLRMLGRRYAEKYLEVAR